MADRCKQSAPSKRWVFTLNNPSEEDNPILWLKDEVDYLYAAPELGDNGTPHWQGFFQTKNPTRVTALRKLNERAHFDKMAGTMEQNLTYCSKQQLPDAPTAVTLGTFPETPGEREKNRWVRIHTLAKGGDKQAFIDEFPTESFLHKTKFETWVAHYRPAPVSLPHTVRHLYFYGESGTGKSLAARTRYPGLYVKDGTKWWQDYNGEEVVLMDDLDPGDLKEIGTSVLKTWFDIYPFRAAVKGSSLGLIRPKLFVITSNFTMNQLCYGHEHLEAALNRRFHVVNFNEEVPDASLFQYEKLPGDVWVKKE